MNSSPAPVRVLQIGCGGITGAWLPPALANPDIEFVGLCDLFPEAAVKLRDKHELPATLPIFGDAQNRAARTQTRRGFRLHDSFGAHAQRVVGVREWRARFERKAARRKLCQTRGAPLTPPTTRARFTRSRKIIVMRSARAVCERFCKRRAWRGHNDQRGYVSGRAFRRIPRRNEARSAARHGDPYFRHDALYQRRQRQFGVLSRVESARQLVCARRERVGDFRDERGHRRHFRGSWCATGLPSGFQSSWRIIGERGTVLWDGDQGFQCEIEDGDSGFMRPVKAVEVPGDDFGAKASGHGGIMREFVDAIRGGAAPETNAADNLNSLAMVLGAVESSDSGMRVSL